MAQSAVLPELSVSPGLAAPDAAGRLPAGDEHARQAARGASRRVGWIVGPWFDLFFLVNFLWPLAFLPGYVSAEGTPHVNFWMAYFLATPHRWMTILLVVCDPDRRGGRTGRFAAIGVLTAALVAGVYVATGSFQLLALGYALIVGWHFASQHAGILRMYARKAGGGRRWLETWPPRLFVLYAALRLLPGVDQVARYAGLELATVDWLMLGIPAVMLAIELADRPWKHVPKLLYLASFTTLYGSIILAAHFRRDVLCLALLAASTIVHSVEYLAVATFYAWRRRTLGSDGVFRAMARNWTAVFAWYVLACGLLYSFADNATASIVAVWFGINLTASILHCAYDGMIWKLRDPATARLLDVEISTAGASP